MDMKGSDYADEWFGKTNIWGRWWFTNPNCRDSRKYQYKARGFHFTVEQNFVYKCHICGKATSSVNFLKNHLPIIHNRYNKEWLKESGKTPRAIQKANKINIITEETIYFC